MLQYLYFLLCIFAKSFICFLVFSSHHFQISSFQENRILLDFGSYTISQVVISRAFFRNNNMPFLMETIASAKKLIKIKECSFFQKLSNMEIEGIKFPHNFSFDIHIEDIIFFSNYFQMACSTIRVQDIAYKIIISTTFCYKKWNCLALKIKLWLKFKETLNHCLRSDLLKGNRINSVVTAVHYIYQSSKQSKQYHYWRW